MLELNKIYCMDCLEGLKLLDDNSVNCCVTSPPYWGLRDYGVSDQIGLESTPEEYVDKLVAVFREVKRVLRDDGTLWLNLGDSYASVHTGGHKSNKSTVGSNKEGAQEFRQPKANPKTYGLKTKDLVGIPWILAFALRDDGWYLRQDIIWHKPNPMPESVTDRCTKSHEYIFLLSKSQRYYFDNEAIKEQGKQESISRYKYAFSGRDGLIMPDGKEQQIAPKGMRNATVRKGIQYYGQTVQTKELKREMGIPDEVYMIRNKRSVWTVPTQPFKGTHFATFPPKLIEPCILAGCPKDGTVLDPFMGSGTTAMVAMQNQRNYIGFELNPSYIEIAERYRLSFVQQKLF